MHESNANIPPHPRPNPFIRRQRREYVLLGRFCRPVASIAYNLGRVVRLMEQLATPDVWGVA